MSFKVCPPVMVEEEMAATTSDSVLPHCQQGKRDRASALLCFRPGL